VVTVGVTATEAPVCPVLHVYVVPPDAVSVVVCPVQIVLFGPGVAIIEEESVIVTVPVKLAEQFVVSVTV
jgi:hypothetical protein